MKRIGELENKGKLTMKEKIELKKLQKESVSAGNSKNNEKSIFTTDKKEALEYIKISDIQPNPFQPRKHFRVNEIEKLAESISERGKLDTPIVVASLEKIYLGAGQKRLAAYKLLNEKEIEEGKEIFEMKYYNIPAFVVEIEDYTQLSSIGLRENLARENPFVLDTANALARHFKILKEEDEKLSQNKFSEIAKKEFAIESKGTISKYLKIAALDEVVQNVVFEEKYNSFNGLYNLAKSEQGIEEQLETIKQLINGDILSTLIKETPREEINETKEVSDDSFSSTIEEGGESEAEAQEKKKEKKQKIDIDYVFATLKDIEVKDDKVQELIKYLKDFVKNDSTL